MSRLIAPSVGVVGATTVLLDRGNMDRLSRGCMGLPPVMAARAFRGVPGPIMGERNRFELDDIVDILRVCPKRSDCDGNRDELEDRL